MVSADQPAPPCRPPRPGGRPCRHRAPVSAALTNWVEQGYKQVKGELGWTDFQVRSDRAIRRHWMLVCCPFSFCRQASGSPSIPHCLVEPSPSDPQAAPSAARGPSRPGIHTESAVRNSWPAALRAVRAWLAQRSVLRHCWRSWSPAPPPAALQRLLGGLAAGRPVRRPSRQQPARLP